MNWTSHNNIPYDFLIPWDFAWPLYTWYFYVLGLLTAIGSIMNLVALVVLASPTTGPIVDSKEARILVTVLIISDFGGSFSIFISCVGSLGVGTFLGEYVGCEVFSFLALFFGTCTLCTLVLMALHLFIRVTKFQKVVLPLVAIYIGISLVSFIISFTTSIYPGHSRLYSDGISCNPHYFTPPFYVFMVVYVILMNAVAMIYWKIFSYYMEITKTTNATGTKHISKKKRNLVKRFTIFIGVTFVTYLPVFVGVLIVWITYTYPSPEVTVWITVSIYSQNILNPIIYFYTNEVAFKALKYKLGITSHFPTTNGTTSRSVESLPQNP